MNPEKSVAATASRLKATDANDIFCLEIVKSINLTGNVIYFSRWPWLLQPK